MVAHLRAIRPTAYAQYYLTADVVIGGNAGVATIINPATDAGSSLQGLLAKSADGIQALYDMNVRVFYALEMFASANDTGMAAYCTKNGVIIPQSWGVVNTRSSDAESDQIRKSFRVDMAANDIIRLVQWKKEGGTHTVNADGSGGSLPAGTVYGSGILVEVMRMN